MDRVTPLGSDDLEWVVAVTRARRESLVPHAPRFWNPAADATPRHRDFLAHLIADPTSISVRTAHGYLIALDRGDHLLVDDMVVTGGAWPDEGVELLRHVLGHVLRRGRRLRFVVPAFETPRQQAGEVVGLVTTECWWHRDLDPAEASVEGSRADPGDAPVPGGRLVPAPPVYDPGGPVLFVERPSSLELLGSWEEGAARRGARVCVVAQGAGNLALGDELASRGYRLTTRFLETA